MYKKYSVLTITKELFTEIIDQTLQKFGFVDKLHIYDFEIASKLFLKKINIIILLGGTSGTGKSTLAALLASRLGISVNLSTDSIRHIMRNFITKESNPILFASTYEAGQLLDNENIGIKKAVIKGWRYQCDTVFSNLRAVIHNFQKQQQSMVIEGVHLSVSIMKKLMKEYKNIIPFVILIQNEAKHREHFAVRSKFMTMDPKTNKYIQYFQNIRTIHKRFQKNADEMLIPKVDNNNVDRAVGLIHGVVIRTLRKIYEGEQTYDVSRKQAIMVYNEFMHITQSMWKQSKVKELIKMKVNKSELFQRFFEQNDFESTSNNPKNFQQVKANNVQQEIERKRSEELSRNQSQNIQQLLIKENTKGAKKQVQINNVLFYHTEKGQEEVVNVNKKSNSHQNSPKSANSHSIKSMPSAPSHEGSLVSGSILMKHMNKTAGRSSKFSSMSEIDSLRVEEDISSGPDNVDSKSDSDLNVNEIESEEDEIVHQNEFENEQNFSGNQNWHGRQNDIALLSESTISSAQLQGDNQNS